MDFNNNFWKEFPELIFPEVLNNFYSKDVSKDKSDSSKIMWAVYMITSPHSIYYTHNNKEEIVAKDYLKDAKFDWQSIREIIDFYKNGVLTIAEQSLNNWNETMILRDKTIKDLYKQAIELKQDGIKALVEIDKMMSNTAKMFADYKKVKEDFDTEKTKSKGAKTISLADQDDM